MANRSALIPPPHARKYRPNVGMAVFNHEGKVLAGRRKQARYDGGKWKWQLPQGGIERGENALDAAYRELREEMGIRRDDMVYLAEASQDYKYDLPDELILKNPKRPFHGQTQRWFAFYFTAGDAPNLAQAIENDFVGTEWLDLTEMPELIIPFKRPVYEAVVKEFSHIPQQIRDKKLP